MRKRRLIAIIGGAALALAVVVWVVLHLPSVQRDAFETVAQRIDAATGLAVDAGSFRMRVLPASIVIEDLRVAGRGGDLVTLERLEAHWRWRKVLESPPRIDSVLARGLAVDLERLPAPGPAPDEAPAVEVDPWRVVRIDRLELQQGAATGELADLGWWVHGLDLRGFVTPSGARAEVRAAGIEMSRGGRRLPAGPLELVAEVDPERGLEVEELELAGSALAVSLRATSTMGEAPRAEVTGRVELAPVELLEWWDPELAAAIPIEGRLDLTVGVEVDGLDDVRFETSHVGAPVRCAGLGLDRLRVAGDLDEVRAELAGGGWGEVDAIWRREGVASATVSLEGARPAAIVSALGLPWPARIDRGLELNGRLEAAGPLPPTLSSLQAAADLRAAVAEVDLELEGSLADGEVRISRLAARAPGAELVASGQGDLGGTIEGELEVTVADLAETAQVFEEWLPQQLAALDLGGRLDATLEVRGRFDDPDVELAAGWSEPRLAGVRGTRLEATLQGDRRRIDWTVEAQAFDGVEATAEGWTAPADLATTGTWELASEDLRSLQGRGLPVAVPEIAGRVGGDGDFSWSPDAWSVAGRLRGADLGWQGWEAPEAALAFVADPEAVSLPELSLAIAGGRIAGSGEVPIGDLDGPIDLDLAWLGVDLAALPVAVPPEAIGVTGGTLRLRGTVADPIGEAEIGWTGASPESQLVDRFRVLGSLEGGILRLVGDELVTDLGPLDLRVTAPLGDLPRPEWLLRGVPGGAVRVTARAEGASTSGLRTAEGAHARPMSASADLRLDLEWFPPDPKAAFGELRAENLTIDTQYGLLRADRPLVVELRPGSLSVLPFELHTPITEIELAGNVDLLEGSIDAAVEAKLSAEAARLLPIPAGARGAMTFNLEVRGPLTAPNGRVAIDHRGGTITVRDPALEITDLHVEAAVEDGVISIDNGSAGVNRGRVEFGGGWDPASGQGVVAELTNVVLLLPGGILTAWSGNLAIEPDRERLARVVGELVLESGLWDSPFNLTSTVFGTGGLDTGTDELLYDIGLELQVRGRRGVRVENNLGDLEVNWNSLRVTGTAAEPVVRGELKIAPGGRITLAGQEVVVRRGVIRMTGDPATDPQIEIVPEQDLASYEAGATGEGGGLDTELLATKSLARGVGSALGFENETLEPAEIAIETETASASVFSIGQRLTSNIALLLSTDLADPAQRTTMVQLWNFSRLPGLAAQIYESTEAEGSGANLIQRFRWGGTAPSDDRPTIHRLKMEGEWPISARRARKATGLSRGQPYDPFLLFAARIRLEEELAGRGYHLARVDGRAEGSERSPTLVFTCDAGPLTPVRFVGDVPPRKVQREVTALYQVPPLDGPAMAAMRQALLRHAWSKGHAAAAVEVERRNGEILARVELGPTAEFTGPFLHGFPDETAESVRTLLATPTELAAALEDPDRVERAVQRILRSRGWEEARLRSVTGGRGPEGEVEVHLELDAGPRTMIAEVRTLGEDPLGLLAPDRVPLASGDPADRLEVEQATSSIRFAYVEAGYADVQLHSQLMATDGGQTVLELDLIPGSQRVVAETRVVGLRHLSERVVRHGLTLEPGDVLKPSEVDRSVVAIGTFAPVERVDMRTIPAGPGRDVVELEVTEKPRWTVEAGAGWSTERGSELRLGLRDDNLFHRGLGLNLRGRWQSSEQLALLVVSLPPLPGSRWRFGSTLRYFDGPNPEFADESLQTQYSASLEATFERSATDTLRGYYEIRRTTNTFVCPDPDDPFCIVDESTIAESILGGAFFRDRMDNLFDPRRGYSLSLDISSNRPQVGSDLSDTRLTLGGGLAMEPVDGWTWAHRLSLGWAKGWNGYELAPTRKFYAGGQGSIRGFEKDSVVPVDATLVSRGGGALFVLNEELRIPVWGPIRAAVFVDVGQVWETWQDADLELAVGAGLGVRVSTPIGPIWADVAWPVANVNELTERGARFYLGIGRPF